MSNIRFPNTQNIVIKRKYKFPDGSTDVAAVLIEATPAMAKDHLALSGSTFINKKFAALLAKKPGGDKAELISETFEKV